LPTEITKQYFLKIAVPERKNQQEKRRPLWKNRNDGLSLMTSCRPNKISFVPGLLLMGKIPESKSQYCFPMIFQSKSRTASLQGRQFLVQPYQIILNREKWIKTKLDTNFRPEDGF